MSTKSLRVWFFAVVATYFVIQWVALPHVGLTDDDDFYIPAGIAYADWLGGIVQFDAHAWSRRGIDAAFQINREHPPIAKYVFGLCHWAFGSLLGPLDSARSGTVLFSTLLAALMLWVCIEHLGRARGLRVGTFAVFFLLTLPRFFFHSHAATLDVPVAAMYFACFALILRGERSRPAAFWAGPVFGLAAATKLNAPFIVLPYICFVLLGRSFGFNNLRTGFKAPTIPAAMLSMAVLGPLVFFLVWPWLWFDTVDRVQEYVRFHLHHYGIYFLYFGRVYASGPYAPWHAPFVMTAFTVPVVTLLLSLFGGLGVLPMLVRRVVERRNGDAPMRKSADLWLFAALNGVFTISIVAFAGTPIYGGAKLFMPFFPFLCLFAGLGASLMVERLALETGWRRRATACVAVLGVGGIALMFRFGEFALSEYNGFAGGLRGATQMGFERQYYDVAYRGLVDRLNRDAPRGTKVHFLPNNWEYIRTYGWYRKAGRLRSDISVVKNEAAADWVVVTHERRFERYSDDLARYLSRPIVFERSLDSTPLYTVFER